LQIAELYNSAEPQILAEKSKKKIVPQEVNSIQNEPEIIPKISSENITQVIASLKSESKLKQPLE